MLSFPPNLVRLFIFATVYVPVVDVVGLLI